MQAFWKRVGSFGRGPLPHWKRIIIASVTVASQHSCLARPRQQIRSDLYYRRYHIATNIALIELPATKCWIVIRQQVRSGWDIALEVGTGRYLYTPAVQNLFSRPPPTGLRSIKSRRSPTHTPHHARTHPSATQHSPRSYTAPTPPHTPPLLHGLRVGLNVVEPT